MSKAATVKFYVGNRWIRGATSVKVDPSGGETQGIQGGVSEPVGYMTTPKGMTAITFEYTPLAVDPDWDYLRELERTGAETPCIYQLGTKRDLYRDGVVQPLPRDTQDGGMASKVSVKIVAMPALPA
jgi:hypothetical protein